jgi:hypothetical protein
MTGDLRGQLHPIWNVNDSLNFLTDYIEIEIEIETYPLRFYQLSAEKIVSPNIIQKMIFMQRDRLAIFD